MAPHLEEATTASTSSTDAKNSHTGYPKDKPYTVALNSAPHTAERIPYIPSEADALIDPGVARANCAPTIEKPDGTEEWTKRHSDKTVVQQHAVYFDKDGDGIIWPADTYHGCRAFGWNILLAGFATYIIHSGLSYPTVPGLLPDPCFRIWIANTHKAKHGSDSMSYDMEGRFRPQNFEDFFSKYDRDGKGGLDAYDLWHAWNGQKLVFDFFGWLATALEWLAVYLLLWPDDGIIRKEDVRGVFDGSIFQKVADQHAEKQRRAYMLKK